MDELIARMTKQLQMEEGTKLMPYYDTKGILTIGTGRNIQQVGIRPDEAALMLSNDIRVALQALNQFAWFRSLSPVRQGALLDMAFMGLHRLLEFVNMIHFLTIGNYSSAAAEARNYEWYKDVGHIRGERVATQIMTGAWPLDVPFP